MANNGIMLVSNEERKRHRTVSKDTMTQNKSQPDQWATLLHQVGQHSDRQAYVCLYQHFAPQLKAYGLSTQAVAGVSAFADDLVQETMIKVWKRASAYDQQKAGASTWVFAIARNTRIDLLRRRARHTAHLDADDVWLEAEPDAAPERTYEADRARTSIRAAIDQLPIEQSQVLAKVYLEGKTHNEVALELSLPLGAVKSRVRLALNKMKLLVKQ